MHDKKNILISPLNWGLGHATRLIPIIETLIFQNHNVIIAGNGSSYKLLKQIFPNLKFYYVNAPEIYYGKNRAINSKLAWCFIKQVLNIPIERKKVSKIVKKENIDIIITDTRPGIFSKRTINIYLTHQINVFLSSKQGVIAKLLTYYHHHIIKNYNYCLVPDIKSKNSLSGRMSFCKTLSNVEYIGILSRFTSSKEEIIENEIDVLCILSGPEPQRSLLEQALISQIKNANYKAVIIRGITTENKIYKEDNILFYNNTNDEQLLKLINSSKLIICRSGYSSIMDLAKIGRKAFLIPTPGQPEQEYLAKRLNTLYGFDCCSQKQLIIPNPKNINNEQYFWFDNNNNLENFLNKIL